MKIDRMLALYNLIPFSPRSIDVNTLRSRLSETDIEFRISLRQLQRDLRCIESSRYFNIISQGQSRTLWSKKPHFIEIAGWRQYSAKNDDKYLQIS